MNRQSRPWRLTLAQRCEIARRYALGHKTQIIADAFGVCQSLVCQTARARGVPMRQPKKSAALRKRWAQARGPA